MKRRTALAVLLVVSVGVALSHLELQSADGRWLLRVDGRPLDVAGAVGERWTTLTRDCRRVQRLDAAAPAHAAALEALRAYSPPDSRSAEITALLAEGDWLLAQVRFARLHDAVVLLQQSRAGVAVAEGGVWSGSTQPYRPQPFIRQYLRARVPEAPPALTDCLDAPA